MNVEAIDLKPEGAAPPEIKGGPEVSIIIPARNQAARLPAFFAALERQTLSPDRYEVIVVDDWSSDRTYDVAREHGAHAIRLAQHGGPYVARNTGLERARGKVIAFTDADCEPMDTWLENGLRALRESHTDMLAGAFLIPLSERPTVAELIHFARYLDQRRNAEEHSLSGGGNLWVRREVFDRVGVFNARLLSGGDKEFCQRAVEQGATIEYAEDVVTVHPACRSHRVAARRAFRLGFGVAQHRYLAEGPARTHPLVCARPGAYIPRRRIYGSDRLEGAGVQLTTMQHFLLPLAEYFTIRLPIVAGNLVGLIKEGVLRPRGELAP